MHKSSHMVLHLEVEMLLVAVGQVKELFTLPKMVPT